MKAKKTKAIIIAMAAVTGATVSQESAAARKAMQDMRDEFGKANTFALNYTWDPFDGMCA